LRRYRIFFWLAIIIIGLIGLVILWKSQEFNPIQVEWSTASEIDTAGFNLYRSENLTGPFVKINANLIPASGDPLVGGKYQYLDESVEPGRSYYYELEDVENSGATSRHGPIQVSGGGMGRYKIAEFILAGGVVMIGLFGFIRDFLRERRTSPTHETT